MTFLLNKAEQDQILCLKKVPPRGDFYVLRTDFEFLKELNKIINLTLSH